MHIQEGEIDGNVVLAAQTFRHGRSSYVLESTGKRKVYLFFGCSFFG
jgi:hypothetical protein